MNAHTTNEWRRRATRKPIYTPTVDFTAWPSWSLRLERWLNTPFQADCLRSIAAEAAGPGPSWRRDDAVYYAALAAADGCPDSLAELIDLLNAPEPVGDAFDRGEGWDGTNCGFATRGGVL